MFVSYYIRMGLCLLAAKLNNLFSASVYNFGVENEMGCLWFMIVEGAVGERVSGRARKFQEIRVKWEMGKHW